MRPTAITRLLSAGLALVGLAACQRASGDAAARGERRELSLPAGGVLELRAAQEITSRHNHLGDPVEATVLAPALNSHGDTVIPEGATLQGAVTAIAPAENPGEPGTLRLAFTSVRFGGRSFPLQVRVVSLATHMEGRGVTTGDAAKVGIGTVAGGIAGRVIGGNKTGTLVGAAAGAAAGGVYAHHTRDVDIVMARGAPIRVKLTEPFGRDLAARKP